MKIIIVLFSVMLCGCATRSYVDRVVSERCDSVRKIARDDHMKNVEYICDVERKMDKCVIAGPNLRVSLQSRVDAQEDIAEAKQLVIKAKHLVDMAKSEMED